MNTKLIYLFANILFILDDSTCDSLWADTTLAWTASYKGNHSAILHLRGDLHNIIYRFSKGIYSKKDAYEFKSVKETEENSLKFGISLNHKENESIVSDLVSGKICFVSNYSVTYCPYELPISQKVYSLSYDWQNNNIYWADFSLKLIGVFSMINKAWNVVISEGLSGPISIVTAPEPEYIFWIDTGNNLAIERANMLGENRTTIVKNDLIHPSNLFFDRILSEIFWLDTGLKTLFRSDLDGKNKRTYKDKKNQNIFNSFVVSWPYVVFGTNKDLLVYKMTNYNSRLTYITSITFKSYTNVKSLAISNPLLQQSSRSVCSKENGKCNHICLQRDGNAVCRCGVGYELQKDNKTCLFKTDLSRKKSEVTIFDTEGKLIEVNEFSGNQFVSYRIPEKIFHFGFDSDFQMLFYSSYSIIYRLSLKSKQLKRIYSSNILNTINSLEILKSKKIIYFTTDKSELKSMDYEGKNIKTITSFNFPDSKILAFDQNEKVFYIGDCWSKTVYFIDKDNPEKKQVFLQGFCVKTLILNHRESYFFIDDEGEFISNDFTPNKVPRKRETYIRNRSENLENLHKNYINYTFKKINSFSKFILNSANSTLTTNFTSASKIDRFIYLTDQSSHCVWKVDTRSKRVVRMNKLPINHPVYVLPLHNLTGSSYGIYFTLPFILMALVIVAVELN